MGYRHYLGKMPRKKFEKIRDSKLETLLKSFKANSEDDHLGFYDIMDKYGRVIFEMGKWSEIGADMTAEGTQAFSGDVADYFDEYGVTLVSKEDLLKIIKFYSKETEEYFKSLLEGKDPYVQDLHFNQKIQEWTVSKKGYPRALNLDLSQPQLTDSFFYEYSLFELARIYKEYDEKKDVILLYGW